MTSTCIKRLMKEETNLRKKPLEFAEAFPNEKNIKEWYFLIRGPSDSHYKGGRYLGKIIFPSEYPLKAPDYYMLTPNGRFETGGKICLTISSFHNESWQPIWNVSSILEAFISIMVADVDSGIRHIKKDKTTRQTLASQSDAYNKTNYKEIYKKFSEIEKDSEKQKKKLIKLEKLKKAKAELKKKKAKESA